MTKPKKEYLVKLMCDSGAFSAWNKGGVLSLKDYCAYIKEHQHLLYHYISLDQIPGSPDRPKRTAQEVEISAAKSYDNLQKMKAEGLRPIPVFHQHERFYWLERMLADGEDYIGFSVNKDMAIGIKADWLNTIFTILTNSKGEPLVKTHGFGTTIPDFLFRYPWTTVDSTTWTLTPAHGMCIVPVYRDGKPQYLKPPFTLPVSGILQKATSFFGDRQLERLEYEGQVLNHATIVKYLTEEVGVSVQEVRYACEAREKTVLRYYKGIMDALPRVRFLHRHMGFVLRSKFKVKGQALKDNHLMIMYATIMRGAAKSKTLTEAGANTRLVSYFETKNTPIELMEEYVTKGYIGDYRKRHRNLHKADWGTSYKTYRTLHNMDRLKEQVK